MNIQIQRYETADAEAACAIWNQVVGEGNAFPQEEPLTARTGDAFFKEQTYTGVARGEGGGIVGLYILHPNNVGRCGHICNASYAVEKSARGARVGERLVLDCVARAREYGYRILQFNAVVASNVRALRLYEKLGFIRLGTIPGGFRKRDGTYEDIIPHYYIL